MQAKDLRVEAPRRWNERIEGVPWLPRLIDKARAAHAGTLGLYLYGQSPTDGSCLRALGLRHRDLLEIVATNEDDAAVMRAIARRNPQAIERGRAWGERYCRTYAWFFFLLDLDDRYVRSAWRPLHPVISIVANAVSWSAKRLWPYRLTRRTTR
jgi:hypothetical protein